MFTTEKTFEADDFKDFEAVERLTGVDFDSEDEIECNISCNAPSYRAATRLDPEEGGEVEDIEVDWGGICLLHHLTDRAYEILKEELNTEAYEQF